LNQLIPSFPTALQPGRRILLNGRRPDWINLTGFSLRLQQNAPNDPSGGASSFALFASRDGINFLAVSGGSIPSGAGGNY
jgi:hypothetical protein